AALHDTVLGRADAERGRVEGLLRGETFQAFRRLEGITALQPPVADVLEAEIRKLADTLFSCPYPNRGSVEERLRQGPVHDCGLTPVAGEALLAASWNIADGAEELLHKALGRKLELFLNPGIRQRLGQERKEPLIEALLAAETVEEVQAVLVPAV